MCLLYLLSAYAVTKKRSLKCVTYVSALWIPVMATMNVRPVWTWQIKWRILKTHMRQQLNYH